ncbi:MAG: hypothetical protein ACOH2Q_20055 [Rhodococcus sp. (in: high G+C Gram-positive bacteria)]
MMWNQQPRQQNMETEQMAAVAGRDFWGQTGVWVAYYEDRSGAVPFATEIEALRHAVGTSMMVRLVPFGEGVFE